MTSVRTIVSDLYRNRSSRIRGMAAIGSSSAGEYALLSPFYRVKQLASPITMTADGPPDDSFTMTAAPLNAANGFYLFFEDSFSTLATLTRAHRIVAGGGYSGCLYSVYNTGGGVFKCIHTARPSGANADAFVAGIRGYAAACGWTLVHEVPTINDATGGIGINGCVTTFIVTRVSYTINPNPIVRTVRLRQNSQGISVGWDRWNTPVP